MLAAHEARPDGERGTPLLGEGAAAFVLKRLEDAEADGDRIYAVIKGMASASGGGVETTVPTERAYASSLSRAYEASGIDPSTVGYIETHGSGIPCEDLAERSALDKHFATLREWPATGSVKEAVGHAGAASGMASLTKTALALYNRVLPGPARHWLRDRAEAPRRAGVSGMSVDGNCCHVVLEEYAPETYHEPIGHSGPTTDGLFAIEAEDEAGLAAEARRLTDWLASQTADHDDDDARRLAARWHSRKPAPAFPQARRRRRRRTQHRRERLAARRRQDASVREQEAVGARRKRRVRLPWLGKSSPRHGARARFALSRDPPSSRPRERLLETPDGARMFLGGYATWRYRRRTITLSSSAKSPSEH